MNVKTLFAAIGFAVVSVSTPVFAEGEDREQTVAAVQEFMVAAKERLQITDEQAPLVEEIMKESMERREAILAKYEGNGGEKPRARLQKIRSMRDELEGAGQDTYNKMSDVLTPEQLDEFKVIQQEMREKMRERLRAR